jgi:hypothetical protein
MIYIKIKNLFKTLSFLLIFYFFLTHQSMAEDVSKVLSNVDSKTGEIQKWVGTTFVHLVAFFSFIAWVVGLALKKLTWSEGIAVIIIIVLLGASPEIVSALLSATSAHS